MAVGGGTALVEKQGYLLDNGWQQARMRLQSLEEYSDVGTQRRVEALGAREGWRCADVGCGAGSMARWLSQRVGPTGHVVAVDMDPRFMVGPHAPNLEVVKQDVVQQKLPERTFDFILARYVLMHVHERDQVLKDLVAALKPGGWLLVEDMESFSSLETEDSVHRRVLEAQYTLGRAAGMALNWARRVPGELQRHGLHHVGAEAQTPYFPGGSAPANFLRLSAEQLRARLVQLGLLHDQDVEYFRQRLLDPTSWFYGLTTIASWGQRPHMPYD
jgi:2-polyprenyl-3-methyl-5-hydroxy-6-metoxy-1,4-benzoquinol methylase